MKKFKKEILFMHFNKLIVTGLIGVSLVTTSGTSYVLAYEVNNNNGTQVYNSGTQVDDCLEYLHLNSESNEIKEIDKGVKNEDIEIPKNIGTPNVEEYCNIREKASETSDSIARLQKYGLVEILDAETYEDFVKVKIGEIIGFVNKDYLYTGEKARKYIKNNLDKYQEGVTLKEGVFAVAGYKTRKQASEEVEDFKEKISVDGNVTVYATKSTKSEKKGQYKTIEVAKLKKSDCAYVYAEKDTSSTRLGMAVQSEDLRIKNKGEKFTKIVTTNNIEGYIKNSELKFVEKRVKVSNIVTSINKDSKVKLVTEGKTWCKVKIGNKHGFVERENISITHKTGKKSKSTDVINYGEVINVEKEGKKFIKTEAGYVNKNFLSTSVVQDLAKLEILPEVKEDKKLDKNINYNVGGEAKGRAKDVIEYALQFLGNPYVWGGNSLTKGVDCSGFVREIYKHFGYSLPRVACDQANTYKEVDIEDVKPADLVFYHNGYRVSHVAMYIGDNKVLHASNPKDGIKISEWTYRKPYKVVRLLKEENKYGDK